MIYGAEHERAFIKETAFLTLWRAVNSARAANSKPGFGLGEMQAALLFFSLQSPKVPTLEQLAAFESNDPNARRKK